MLEVVNGRGYGLDTEEDFLGKDPLLYEVLSGWRDSVQCQLDSFIREESALDRY